MTVLSLPWPDKSLHPNARVHWAKRAKATKIARIEAAWATKAAYLRVDPGLVPMTITFFPPDNRRRDRDGMISAIKAQLDGIADALGVDDNCFRPSFAFGSPVKGGLVSIEVVG